MARRAPDCFNARSSPTSGRARCIVCSSLGDWNSGAGASKVIFLAKLRPSPKRASQALDLAVDEVEGFDCTVVGAASELLPFNLVERLLG